MRKCTLKLLDQTNCVFVGMHPDHIGYFYEEYGVFAENHFFNPKFKLGSWDGKIRYFHKTGKTYVNLLDDILPKVVSLGYNISLVDNRKIANLKQPKPIDTSFFSDITDPETDKPWKVREYQVEMVNRLLESNGGIGIVGTGGGKTGCCAAIAKSYELAGGYRSLIIVPDKSLTSQTYKEYEFFGVDVGEYSGDRKDIDHNHVVSTWQSLQYNPTLVQQFDVIIVDECHGLKGPVLLKMLVEYAKDVPFRFGVTGTLPKGEADKFSVLMAVGAVKYEVPAHILQSEGHLAKMHIDIIQLEEDFTKEYEEWKRVEQEMWVKDNPGINMTYKRFKDMYFPDFTTEKRYLQTKKERLQWIADCIEVKRNEYKGNVFCLVNGITVGKKLAKLVENSIFVYGNDKVKVREEAYDLFKDNNDVVVIATVNIASTGLNIKRIFNLMFIDMGKSFVRTIQTIGRGLRKAPDKEYVNVTDICSDLKYSKKHVRERIKYYKEAKYKHKKHIVDYDSQKE